MLGNVEDFHRFKGKLIQAIALDVIPEEGIELIAEEFSKQAELDNQDYQPVDLYMDVAEYLLNQG